MDVDGEGPVYAVAGVGLDAILEVGEVQSGADGTHVDTVMGSKKGRFRIAKDAGKLRTVHCVCKSNQLIDLL